MKLETQMIPQVVIVLTPDETEQLHDILTDDETCFGTHSMGQGDFMDEFISKLKELAGD